MKQRDRQPAGTESRGNGVSAAQAGPVGAPHPHESGAGHVTGRALYTDDQRQPTGMLSVWPVVSPHARARIVGLDTTAALTVEGVVTVLTAADIPGENDTGPSRRDEPLLPVTEVSYHHQPVAWVVGASETAARLGAQQVQVAYAPLEPILSIAEALQADSFHTDPTVISRGDGGHQGDARTEGDTTHRSVPFEQVVHQACLSRISLAATGYYGTPNLHYDEATGRGTPFHYFAYGAAVSEVQVDGWTGEFRLLRVDILHDVGDSLNPLVDRGQIEGGFIQGMGWLTGEELVWNDEDRLLTHAPSTYKIPAITDVPDEFHVRLLPRAAQKGVIHGSKAVGEPPLMLALSVREAIRDAVAAFAAPDAPPAPVLLPSPATPEAILQAIHWVRSGVPLAEQELATGAEETGDPG